MLTTIYDHFCWNNYQKVDFNITYVRYAENTIILYEVMNNLTSKVSLSIDNLEQIVKTCDISKERY